MAKKKVKPNLPEEIIVEILLRLPVKSLYRFRCVSKLWLALISDPQFIKTHSNRTPAQHSLILDFCGRPYTVNLPSSSSSSIAVRNGNFDVAIASKLQLPYAEDDGYYLRGSCNGFLLFQKLETDSVFIYNPSTRSFRDIPYHILCPDASEFPELIGFGHDPSIDDYKVVIRLGKFVSVYTLGANSSRKVEDCPLDPPPFKGTLLHGALHWSGGQCLLSFDLAKEKFNLMELPSPFNTSSLHSLGVYKGRLCLRYYLSSEITEFWVMNEYGVSESWTKVNLGIAYRYFIPFDLGDEMLYLVDKKTFMWESGGQMIREFVIQGTPDEVFSGYAEVYRETLVSPKHIM